MSKRKLEIALVLGMLSSYLLIPVRDEHLGGYIYMYIMYWSNSIVYGIFPKLGLSIIISSLLFKNTISSLVNAFGASLLIPSLVGYINVLLSDDGFDRCAPLFGMLPFFVLFLLNIIVFVIPRLRAFAKRAFN